MYQVRGKLAIRSRPPHSTTTANNKAPASTPCIITTLCLLPHFSPPHSVNSLCPSNTVRRRAIVVHWGRARIAMAPTGQIWLIIHAGLTGFVVIPAIVVWFLGLCLARRRRDPARAAFSWVQACHPFFVSQVSSSSSSVTTALRRIHPRLTFAPQVPDAQHRLRHCRRHSHIVAVRRRLL